MIEPEAASPTPVLQVMDYRSHGLLGCITPMVTSLLYTNSSEKEMLIELKETDTSHTCVQDYT